MNIRIMIPLVGLALIGGSLLLHATAGRPVAAGRLVPESSTATWNSPPPDSGVTAETRSPISYLLRNPGGTPLRILSLTSECGCAQPKAEPLLVPAGGSCRVTVSASPLQFGLKRVRIRVMTDSLTTPVVELELRIRGSQKPPFLQSASGDLIFSEPTPGQSRELGVVSVVPTEWEDEPQVVCDLPFVRIKPAHRDTRPEGTVPGIDVRVDWFTVTLDEGVPSDFRGDVRVLDPWIEGHDLPVTVSGATPPRIRVAPARLTLRLHASASSDPYETFMVVTRERELASQVAVKVEDGGPPLVLERGELQGGGLWVPFRVRAPSGTTIESGEYALIVTSSPDLEATRIPIRVIGGDEP